jgi:hypothetical protein
MTLATQGLASYSSTEISNLADLYRSGSADEIKLISGMVRTAQKAMLEAPHAAASIVTSGAAVKSGTAASTSDVAHQSANAYALATAYGVTGDAKYLTQAKSYVLQWAKVNKASGDSVANEPLLKMFQSYDLIRGKMTLTERATVDKWMSGIADKLIAQHKADVAGHSMMAINNHHSFDLLEVGTIGAVLGRADYIHYVTDASGFLQHIGTNLKSFAGEPAHLGVDYDQRHAIHYVAYNMEALTKLAVLVDHIADLPGNPYGIHYNPFTVEVNGASIEHTLGALLPYAAGEKQSLNEFSGSHDANDALRLANGSLDKIFQPGDALDALESADYFGHSLTVNGHSYNFAQLVGAILKSEGKTVVSAALPTMDFLDNRIESDHYAAPTAPSATQTIKVATDDGVHHLDAGSGTIEFTFYKHTGDTQIDHFGASDMLNISSKIYASAADALSHVTYSGGGAHLALDGASQVTLLGVADHALDAHNFHIFAG